MWMIKWYINPMLIPNPKSPLLSYSYHPGTGLLSAHGSCTARCCSLPWLNVLLADWGRRYWNPLICHIMNLSIERQRHLCLPRLDNEIVDQLAKDTLDHGIDPLITVHADLKPLVNSYIQYEFKIKSDVSIHGRDLYLLKPTSGPLKNSQPLIRAEEVVITRLRTGHTKATKSHILSRGPPNICQHFGQTLTHRPHSRQVTEQLPPLGGFHSPQLVYLKVNNATSSENQWLFRSSFKRTLPLYKRSPPFGQHLLCIIGYDMTMWDIFQMY